MSEFGSVILPGLKDNELSDRPLGGCTLNLLRDRVGEVAKLKGWFRPESILESLTHLHSEVSEVYEAHKDNDRFGMAEELADVILITLRICAEQEIDIQEAVDRKMKYNRTR